MFSTRIPKREEGKMFVTATFIFFFIQDVSTSTEVATEVTVLKCKVGVLEKTVDEMKKHIQSLQKDDQKQNVALGKASKLSSKLSTHCSLLPLHVCGECECLDDFEHKERFFCDCQNLPPRRDCLDYYQQGYNKSGVYKVTAGGIKDMQVYCDMDNDGGGWTVFQRRINGEINFYRDWTLYKLGFGTLQREFWLGNDNIYVLTLQSAYPKGSEVRIDMEDWDGKRIYAKYSTFQVDNESSKYKLHVGGYSGTAGDSLLYHSGQNFSTYDQDNDSEEGCCSRTYRGAWWYRYCHVSNLNGEYRWFDEKQPGFARGVIWHADGKYEYSYSMRHVEMKLRRKI